MRARARRVQARPPPRAQMTVILLNLVTGPPLFHAAIVAAGEARALQLPGLAGDAAGAAPRAPSLPKSASKCARPAR